VFIFETRISKIFGLGFREFQPSEQYFSAPTNYKPINLGFVQNLFWSWIFTLQFLCAFKFKPLLY